MFLPVLIIVIVVLGLLIMLLSFKDMDKNKPGWLQFYAKGKDSGFSFKEIDLLHKLAVKSKLEDPSSLFTSQRQLDICIKALVRNLHLSGAENEKSNQDFLSRLYDFRKKIEMEKPSVKNGISNSRQIRDGQSLRILVSGTGVFKSQVIKNTNQYITISRPVSGKLPGTFSWQGQKLSVYFWREEDAGYVFDSEVMDEVFSKGIASLKLSHTDSLFRTQKRKSVRVRTHKAAFLYPVTNEDETNKVETHEGVKCFIEDLSDTGCAVTIGGKAIAGLRLKVQFAIGNATICMSGTVRSVDYKEDLNKSLLHIEADLLPIEIRNVIMGEVFGMHPDEEEELPFRLLGEEADDLTGGPELAGAGAEFFGDDIDNVDSAF